MSTSHARALLPHPLPITPSTFRYESQAESYDRDDYNDYNDYDDYNFAHRRPRGPMVPISVGISSPLSAETTPDQFINEVCVLTGSVHHERDSEGNFAGSTWETPANGLDAHKDVEIMQDKEVSAETEEDAFSDWLQSYPESDPAEAAVDSASLFRSDSLSIGSSCSDYDDLPQRSCGPMVPTTPYSNDPPSATSVLSLFADSLSSPAAQSTHEVKSYNAVAVPTESLAKSEVFAGGVGEHALPAWPSSYFEFNTGEDSKESYSAVLSNPVLAESDSGDGYEVLAVPAPSRFRMAADPVHEDPNACSDPLLFSTDLLELHVSTFSSRDPQPLSFLEPPSSSSVSVTSLSVLPTTLSVSSSSLSVLSSPLSSSHSSLIASSAFLVSLDDQVPLSCSVSVLFPFASDSDFSLTSSPPSAAYRDAGVAGACHLDVTEPSPILRPPEDPPPDVSDELRNWLHAYTVLGIEECSLSSFGDLPSLPDDFDDMPECPTPTDDFGAELLTTSSPAAQAKAADPALGLGVVQPLRRTSILDGKHGYATHTLAGILCPTDSKPADEYNTQSEPDPPDPSSASH